MPEASAPAKNPTDEHRDKYFSFQIKGWTNFDPMAKTLARVAEGIEHGGGFLTLVEVLEVEEDLASIADEEVRECFANILAARRLVKNVHELPKELLEELRSALKPRRRRSQETSYSGCDCSNRRRVGLRAQALAIKKPNWRIGPGFQSNTGACLFSSCSWSAACRAQVNSPILPDMS